MYGKAGKTLIVPNPFPLCLPLLFRIAEAQLVLAGMYLVLVWGVDDAGGGRVSYESRSSCGKDALFIPYVMCYSYVGGPLLLIKELMSPETLSSWAVFFKRMEKLAKCRSYPIHSLRACRFC